MGYEEAWAALNGKRPARVPRTEYCDHPELMEHVTGLPGDSPEAFDAFVRAWDYGFVWNVLVSTPFLREAGARVTELGHAVYNGADWNARVSHPYTDPEQVYAVDPARDFRIFDRADLVRRFEENYRENQRRFPGAVCMSGVYTTMFSGLIELFGWDMLLLAIADDPDRFARVVDSYFEWNRQFFEAYAASSIPVMMVHDDLCWTSGPAAAPAWYRAHIFPKLARLLEPVRGSGKKIIFTSDGLIDEFFSDIVELGVDSVVMEPCCDMERFAREFGAHTGFVGGVDCRTLAYGTREAIRAEVERAIGWGKTCPGFMLAVGNHLPADVPVERALYYQELYRSLTGR